MIAILLALACAKHPEPPVNPNAQPPQIAPTPQFSPVTPQEFELSNGAKLWHVHRPGLPLVSMEMVLPGGGATDPAGAAGTTYLADAMILEGAGDRDATTFSAETDRLAVEIGVSTWGVATIVSLDAHADRFEDGLDLFADAVLRPRFKKEDLSRIKDSALADIKERMDDPRAISGLVMDALYYGEGHPLAPPVSVNNS